MPERPRHFPTLLKKTQVLDVAPVSHALTHARLPSQTIRTKSVSSALRPVSHGFVRHGSASSRQLSNQCLCWLLGLTLTEEKETTAYKDCCLSSAGPGPGTGRAAPRRWRTPAGCRPAPYARRGSIRSGCPRGSVR